MSSRTDTPASSIRQKIADLVAGRLKTEQQIAELEKQARLAEGADRRKKLAALGEQAEIFAATTPQRTADIQVAAEHAVNAIRTLTMAVDHFNDDLGNLRDQLLDAGTGSHTPPSPADSYTAVRDLAVLAAGKRVAPLDVDQIVNQAIAAGRNVKSPPPTVQAPVSDINVPEGPYWRHPEHGGVFIGEAYRKQTPSRNNPDLVEITKVEYLGAQWGLSVRDATDLDPSLLDELTPQERAAIAPQLLATEGN